VRAGYGFGALTSSTTTDLGQGQTIVIVDAFDSPTIFNDLTVFSQEFGLPVPTAQTFEKVYATGVQPSSSTDWNQEIALDCEWSHAIAPDAKIILVEAATNSTNDLYNAVNVAGNLAANTAAGGGVVSMSFGADEPTGGTSASPVLGAQEYELDRIFESYPTVSFCAASGDTFGELSYPATSPYVTAVGGTELTLSSDGSRVLPAETVWHVGTEGSGGGTSAVEPAPVYQQSVLGLAATAFREVPDVSFLADPDTGVATYTTSPDLAGDIGWAEVGGTSLACPMFAATVALANQVRNANNLPVIGNNLNNAIYSMNLNNLGADFNLGGTVGYAAETGWGTPIPSNFINDLSLYGTTGSTPPLYSLDTNSTGIESSIVLYGSIITPIVGSGQASDDFVGRGGDSIATGPTTFTLQLEGTDSLGNTQSLSVACTITDLATGAFTGDLTGSALYTTPTLPTGDTTAIQFQGTVTNGPNGGVAVNGSFELVVINADGTVSTVGHEGIDGSGDGDVQGEFQSS
jgi:subtilase family serine protease